ncbi:Predicted hydroxymethylpyrimidine transporter CytX [Polaromonas sp. CG9_12]|nr:Predicted hydroxymethylpyrimidine transporter CytX [Polaromonas sp. CG9_12]
MVFYRQFLTSALGTVLLALLSGSMVKLARRFIGRYGLPLVHASLLWLSWQLLSKAQAQGLSEIWNRTGDGCMNKLSAVDLGLTSQM